MNSILNIDTKVSTDESITSLETYGFYPITGTQLNQPGSITVTIENSDNFYYPAKSWLEFEGEVKSTTTDYTKDSLITLVNDGILHLFDNVKYLLSSTEIESIFHPAIASTLIGLATYSDNFTLGLNQCWSLDTTDVPADSNLGFKARRSLLFITEPDPLGSFKFGIPLDHIFGFCNDYRKAIYGFVHTLVLTRSSSDNNALFKRKDVTSDPNNVPDGKVELKNLRWMIPRVTPSDVAKYELLKQIKNQVVLSVGFRMRQAITTTVPESNQFTWRLGVRSSPEVPRFILLAFQKLRQEDQQKNIAVFDNLGITSAHILMNNDKYPLNNDPIDFKKNHFNRIYYDFASFVSKFYKINKLVTTTAVGPLEYKSLFPILVFDVSKQSERLKTGVTDITINCNFKETQAAGSVAHAVMISDRLLRFKSDGEKMSVLY